MAAPRPRRRPRIALLASAGTTLVILAAMLTGPPAAAATLEVTTTADGGAGSLRAAFAAAGANAEADEIVLAAGEEYVLDDCAEGDLDHTAVDDLTIDGNGATIRQTCPGERVIETDGDLVVTTTTVTGGSVPGGLGGGIEADTSSVTILGSTVVGNEAATGGGVAAIRVTSVDSTVSGNEATAAGGGIWADQTAEATNSTITGNQAGTGGGGIAVVNTSVTLLFATVAANTSPTGANVQLQAGGDELISFGSVIADPQGSDGCDLAAGVVTTSQGASFASDASCGFGAGADDVDDGGDPLLGPLADNGGPTATMLPAAGSPLLDGADCAAAPSDIDADQRDVSRPQGVRCDVGAVEVEVATPADEPPPALPEPSDEPPATTGGERTPGSPISFSG